jgi:SAM-dependent methyltransferase
MIVGEANRRTAIANVFQLLKPGGVFVLHVHNRYFRELGWKGFRSGDITMPQAYGGAPLTLHHFGRREAVGLLKSARFRIREVLPVAADGELRRPWLFPTRRAYGYLIAAVSELEA